MDREKSNAIVLCCSTVHTPKKDHCIIHLHHVCQCNRDLSNISFSISSSHKRNSNKIISASSEADKKKYPSAAALEEKQLIQISPL